MAKFLIGGLCFLAVAEAATAQLLKKLNPFDSVPTVSVTLEHPPKLGRQIQQIEKVAFAQAEGECADEFVDSLIADFVGNGVQVTDRHHLEALLAEHEFSLSGLVNRSDAVALGEILGPTALVFVTVRRCATNTQQLTNHRKTYTGKMSYEYIARTTAYFKGTIQVVDLATARVYSARTIDETFSRENSSPTGQPEYPDAYETKDAVIERAVRTVNQLFFSWTEDRSLPFYDDKDCNLKLAYSLVLAGDVSGAIEQSQANVEACEVYREKKPRLVARAYYNLGMACCLADDFERGMEFLNYSLQLRPHDVTSKSLAECRRGQQVAAALEDFETGEDPAASSGEAPSDGGQPVEARLAQLKQLHVADLITREVYAKKVAAIISRDGAPGETMEKRLRNLKQLYEQKLISQELYERKVSQVLGDV